MITLDSIVRKLKQQHKGKKRNLKQGVMQCQVC